MSSATYIPLTQISPSEYTWSPKHPLPSSALRQYFTRRRAVYALVATTSVLTLLLFLRLSFAHGDDYDDFDDYEPFNVTGQPSYIAIPVRHALPETAQPKLRPTRDLPLDCLDRYYSSGLLCHDSLGPVPMDVLWTWVNGTDPLFAAAKQRAVDRYAPDDPFRPIKKNNPARMFRDHDELRHSVRSVLDNFRPYTRHFRILTSDFDYPDQDAYHQTFPHPGAGHWRLGLQPQWLESSDSPQWQDGDIQLSLTHHAHFFQPYHDTNFNSYAIESQFSHLQDVSESFIYMNDDFYMLKPLTPASFYTSPYGTVLRMDPTLQVSPKRPHSLIQGEWRSMGESNWLLSNRFGARKRPYIVHEAKAVSFSMLQELALVWPGALNETATHAFRETEAGRGDFYQMFVHAHYIVERAREALLWAWAVGRIGRADDGWGADETALAWRELGGLTEDQDGQSHELKVEAYPRDTLHPERIKENLEEAGYPGSSRTTYEFSALDGYAYGIYENKKEDEWPRFGISDVRPQCTIKRDECFPPGTTRASDLFKYIAFEKPECGDCVILALVKASGPLGLSAFLPSTERRVVSSNRHPNPDDAIPHLPLVDNWHDGQFALRDVMKDARTSSVREYALMVLQRYRYVVGSTPSEFDQLLSYGQVRAMLRYVDRNKDLALLCINDDLGREDERVSRVFFDWQERHWPRPAAWEADGGHQAEPKADNGSGDEDEEDDEDEDEEHDGNEGGNGDGHNADVDDEDEDAPDSDERPAPATEDESSRDST
ncbi:hypothetical protein BD413DRAFT_478467 [Trametes elegans]|nr:hypothetical protein BD413DRAFT_478467 [Trametes elegans]